MTLFPRFASEHFRRSRFNKPLTFGILAALCMTCSCARLPPSQSTQVSGRRIRVSITFRSQPDPSFYYFFVINRYGPKGTSGAKGPIPVIGLFGPNSSIGNGFATGSQGGVGNVNGTMDYGLTDLVMYHNGQSNNIGLYHFTRDPNTQQPWRENPYTQPISFSRPEDNPNNPTLLRTIQFDIDMVQLVTDTNNTAAKIAEAKQIQYLQVNIIATNVAPIDPTYNGLKEVDAMGDGRNFSELQSFREIDLGISRTYSSTDNIGIGLSPEPTGDVYPINNSPDQNILDIESWTIDVQPSS